MYFSAEPKKSRTYLDILLNWVYRHKSHMVVNFTMAGYAFLSVFELLFHWEYASIFVKLTN